MKPASIVVLSLLSWCDSLDNGCTPRVLPENEAMSSTDVTQSTDVPTQSGSGLSDTRETSVAEESTESHLPDTGNPASYVFELDWSLQWGTAAGDSSPRIAVIGDAVYVTGHTSGDLDGYINNGGDGSLDAFLVKFSHSGEKLWTRVWGSTGDEWPSDVLVADGGDVLVFADSVKWVDEPVPPDNQTQDFWLTRFDSSGAIMDIANFGSDNYDRSRRMVASGANVLLLGETQGDFGALNKGMSDAVIMLRTLGGDTVWTKQVGTPENDIASAGVFTNTGKIVVCGTTWGDLSAPQGGSGDFFVLQMDSGGAIDWVLQWGSSATDTVEDVQLDAKGDFLLVGTENYGDAILASVSSDGNLLWSRNLGDMYSLGGATGVRQLPGGSLMIVGEAHQSMPKNIDYGWPDAGMLHIDASSGELFWAHQWGSSEEESITDFGVFGASIFVVGDTRGDMFGPNLGYTDLFIAKWTVLSM